jgi:hypothetical protein
MANPLADFLREYGYSDRQLPKIAGQYEGKGLIVAGDAACLWADLEAFGARRDVGRGSVGKCGWDIMTVNKVVEVMPANIEHIYSNEPGLLAKFCAARRNEYVKEFESPRHSHSCKPGARWEWPYQGHGTSALGATIAGIGMGYDAVVLCGIPLDDGPHNGEPPWRKCRFKSAEAAGNVETGWNRYWERAAKIAFKGKVKSMSGRTREWLGAPG